MKTALILGSFAIALLIGLPPTPLHASQGGGGSVGNGGNGVWLKGHLYSLDLVEAGVEEHPAFDWDIQPDPAIQAILSEKFAGKRDIPVNLLVRKLSEIDRVSPGIAILLAKTIAFLDWRFVNLPLRDAKDDHSALKFAKGQKVQLAVRKGMNTVQVQSQVRDRMNPANWTALMLHEAIYALSLPEKVTRDGMTYLAQSSEPAKDATGYLFTEEFVNESRTGRFNQFWGKVWDRIPTSGIFHTYSATPIRFVSSSEIEIIPLMTVAQCKEGSLPFCEEERELPLLAFKGDPISTALQNAAEICTRLDLSRPAQARFSYWRFDVESFEFFAPEGTNHGLRPRALRTWQELGDLIEPGKEGCVARLTAIYRSNAALFDQFL